MQEEKMMEQTLETEPEQGATLESEQDTPEEAETPVDEATAKEKLAEEVKQRLLSCAEDTNCLDALSARFEEMATKLGVPTERLIDEVFGLLTHKGS